MSGIGASAEAICEQAAKKIPQLALGEKNGPLLRRFAPRDLLYQYLISGFPSVARQILECRCIRCAKHRHCIGHSSSTEEKLQAILGSSGNPPFNPKEPPYRSSALVLFSLFVAIRHPALITTLLNRRIDDNSLQSGPRNALVVLEERSNWHWMDDVDYEGTFMGALERFLPMFAVPHFENNHYAEFEASTVLPFVEEEHIGRKGPNDEVVDEGGFGRIYGFKIYDCYNQLRVNESFVRKELSYAVPLQFLARQFSSEANNLHTVGRIQSNNIVKVVKTYRHGDRYNIIFRKEKSDLHHYLRDDEWSAESEDLRRGPLECCTIWAHALGITEALGKISRIEASDAYGSDPYKRVPMNGFHFDLKPANVLVSDTTWLITDFGIARFERATDGATSRVMSQPGTDSYAPPEMLNVTEKLSRRYDVWSLGCILLEVIAFAVGGKRALHKLDVARESRTGNITDHRFWQRIPGRENECEVKPSIVKFKDSLKQERKASSSAARHFLQQLSDLIDNMLKPHAEDRWDISRVVPDLTHIIHSTQSPTTPKVQYRDPDPNEGETDLTPDQLRRMRVFLCIGAGSSQSKDELVHARLYTFRSSNDRLRIVIADPNHQQRPISLPLNKKTARLVPEYMFPKEEQEHRVSFESAEHGALPDSTFEFDSSADLKFFQSHMTHQKVSDSFDIMGVVIEKSTGFTRTAFSKAFRKSDTQSGSDFDSVLGRCSVQLWVEEQEAYRLARDEALRSPPRGEGSFPMRSRPQEHVIPIRRLVIYACPSATNDSPRIISVVISGAIRYIMDEERPPGLNANVTRFVPNKPRDDKYISISVVRSQDPSQGPRALPSIPLDITSLRKEELGNATDCKRIDLEFIDQNARQDFERAFNRFHKERHKEKEKAERVTKTGKRSDSHKWGPLDSTNPTLNVPSSSGGSMHSGEKGKGRADEGFLSEMKALDIGKPKRKRLPALPGVTKPS